LSGHTVPYAVVKEVDGNRSFFSFSAHPPRQFPFVLRYVPLTTPEPAEAQHCEIMVDQRTALIPLDIKPEETCGMILYILKPARNDSYDVTEPFPPCQSIWTIKHKAINLKSGKEIMGRQDFPDVYEPDGTFLISRRDIFSNIYEMFAAGKAAGFVMHEDHSIRIDSELDLLRYKAFLKANAYWRATERAFL
jgi:hypothetical protein